MSTALDMEIVDQELFSNLIDTKQTWYFFFTDESWSGTTLEVHPVYYHNETYDFYQFVNKKFFRKIYLTPKQQSQLAHHRTVYVSHWMEPGIITKSKLKVYMFVLLIMNICKKINIFNFNIIYQPIMIRFFYFINW